MEYSTGLPMRGLIPVLIENLRSFRDGWWLKLLLLAAVFGATPVIRSNTVLVLTITGIAISIYTVALWKSYRYERSGNNFHIRSGLAEKLRVHLHTSQISRVVLERNQWCLLLGLVNVSVYTEGNNESSASIQYISKEMARQLAGDLLPKDKTELKDSVFYHSSWLDALRGACLVPSKQLIMPALITFAIVMPVLNSSIDRPDEAILKDGAVDQAASLFTTAISPGAISFIIVMLIVLVVGLSILARLFIAFPSFLGTEIKLRDNQIFVRSGIFSLRQWRLPLVDIATVEVRNGFWPRLFGGSAVLLQTRGAELQPGIKGNYLPFLPHEKIAELFEITDLKPVELPRRKLELFNFLVDAGRVLLGASPYLIAVALFLPVTFWTSPALSLYAAEAAGLFLALMLWRWRQHWNSGIAATETHVTVGQRRWTNNHTTAHIDDLHGMECYSLPLAKDRLLAIRPGLPAVDQHITAVSPWSPESCISTCRAR
ncbi:PH domain-containing protein [Marinobacter sp. F3R08]|uniref:PH domain-containing protein n=1 Tax=Marinobacter sp. F3R08 TaxID=2841559 RepID=UPI001C099D52|nr:PH domain-containing protein [Marinobacter sp. F3R08]MBU2952202.1 PH domain-containing protein [Marinobacter sp. F3R08]